MPYFVKRTSQTGVPLMHPVTYNRPVAAMKYACEAVVSGIRDIWIEDEKGKCVANRAQIERYRREHVISCLSREVCG